MKILKRLFCKHDYVQTTPDLTGYINNEHGTIGFMCKKCGKFKMA